MTTFFLVLLLLASLAVNVVLIWYIRKLLERFYAFFMDILDIKIHLSEFKKHLTEIISLPLLSEDPVIMDMMKHLKFVIKKTGSFETRYMSFNKDNLMEGEDIEENEEEDLNE